MDRYEKHNLLSITFNGCHFSVSRKKKQISCRVYKEFYDFVNTYYAGKFSEFLDIAMKNFVQSNADKFVENRYAGLNRIYNFSADKMKKETNGNEK